MPGELTAWCDALLDRLAALSEQREETAEGRRQAGQRILREDPGLCSRVTAMRRREADLARELDTLRARARRLHERDGENPTGSWEALAGVQRLRRRLLNWIVEARILEAERRTWLLEAIYRDRGVVD